MSAGDASEQVAEAIRSWMFERGLVPGDRLGREEDLAKRFGVSRPTLREALRLLSSAHLVRATKGPGGGIFVAATAEEAIGRTVQESLSSMLSADTIGIRELLETRQLLEVPLAGLAAVRADDADVAALRGVLGRLEDDRSLAQVDAELHTLIAAVAGNRLATALMHGLADVLQPSLYALIEPALVPEVVSDHHHVIVAAITRGDASSAERAMREHLVYLQDLVSALDEGVS